MNKKDGPFLATSNYTTTDAKTAQEKNTANLKEFSSSQLKTRGAESFFTHMATTCGAQVILCPEIRLAW